MGCDGGSFVLGGEPSMALVGVAVAFAFSIGHYSSAAALRIKPEALSAFDRTNCGIMSIDVEALEYSFATALTVTLTRRLDTPS